MTTYATAIDVSAFTTDAKFRAWVAAVHNAMAGAGFVQTADTGQINPATVLKPTAVSTVAGYEIWRFDDALQSTAPVFMKLWYSSSSVTSGNGMALYVHVGTGSDGAGYLTGLISNLSPGIFTSSTAVSNTSASVMACHTAGYGMILPGALVNATNNAGLCVIARTCNTSGTLTGEGVAIYRQGTANSLLMTASGISFTTGTVFGAVAPRSAVVSTTASMASGDAVPMGKNYAPLGKPVPVNSVLSYYGPDVATLSTFSTPVWGATAHTFLALGTGYVTGMESDAPVGVTAAVMWE